MFSSLFSSRKHKAAQPDHRLNQIYLTLHQSHRNREFLDVSIDGDDRLYQSMLLELDPEEKTLLVDEFFPNDFVGLPGQAIRCTLRQKSGRQIQFESKILERHSYDDAPLYVISLPAELDYDQRRAAFRLPILRHHTIESCFVAPDRHEYAARVRDVSINGVCLETDPDFAESVSPGDTLSDVSFEFVGIPVNCTVAVRNIHQHDNGKFRIGTQFLNMPSIESKRLESAILQVQREQLRRGDRQRDSLAS